MLSQDFTFQVGLNRLTGTIDQPEPPVPVRWLSLHGAGTAHRGLVHYLAEHLTAHGQALLRFDFSGHGDSAGKLPDSTLTQRLAEAKAALQFMDTSSGISLIGSSMGGHIAARLTQHVAVKHLILFYPAAYTRAAETLPFTEQFSAAIRVPGSYHDALAYAALQTFTGHLTIIIGSEDTVIPPEVIERYLQACPHAQSHRLLTIPGAPHRVHGWLDAHPALKATVLAAVTAHESSPEA
jgi:pimeloyl-ACP methyl ester carboxylesterase